jgi:predicted aspartyl protease
MRCLHCRLDGIPVSTDVRNQEKPAARGEAVFNLYEGTVFMDGQECTIPVLCEKEITEVLTGLQLLETRGVVVDSQAGLLTLG